MVGDMHRVRLASAPRTGGPALFVDRDGTLVDDPGYLSDPEQLVLFPGAAASLGRFAKAGYAIVLVTNQSGIGRGYFGWEDYERVAARLRAHLDDEGITLDAECVCGHAPDEGTTCGWRKPAPGMILEAARRLDLDRDRSLMVGDADSDLEAAAAAGLARAVHVATGHGRRVREGQAGWNLPLRVDLVDSISALAP